MTDFREAATLCANRLRILHRLQQQAKERGETEVTLHVEELFEAGDLAALEAYEAALNAHTGAVALPFNGAA